MLTFWTLKAKVVNTVFFTQSATIFTLTDVEVNTLLLSTLQTTRHNHFHVFVYMKGKRESCVSYVVDHLCAVPSLLESNQRKAWEQMWYYTDGP